MKLRLMIAGAIVLFSLFSYMRQSETNPITGESQRVAMSEQEEIALGLQSMPAMVNQHDGHHPDQRAQAFVDMVGGKLLRALNNWIEENQRVNPYQYEFHLLADSRAINAFALPGGQIFITYALFSKLETEDQLAGVLAHEIGHVVSRHGAQRLAKQKLTQGLTGAATVFGGSYQSGQLAAMVGQMVNMKYGRGDELESDEWGVRLCALSNYDPRAMLKVMDILEQATSGKAPPEMMSTHPKPANRKKYIEDVIRRAGIE